MHIAKHKPENVFPRTLYPLPPSYSDFLLVHDCLLSEGALANVDHQLYWIGNHLYVC